FFFGEREGSEVRLAGEDAEHLARSLRTRPGDLIQVVEPAGWLLEVRVTSVSRGEVRGDVLTATPHDPEPGRSVTLALALTPAGALEEALGRCTEVGAHAFQLVAAERSVARPAADRSARWARICREGAMLAGRLVVPEVAAPLDFASAWSGAC